MAIDLFEFSIIFCQVSSETYIICPSGRLGVLGVCIIVNDYTFYAAAASGRMYVICMLQSRPRR